jgi:hypothetical protein
MNYTPNRKVIASAAIGVDIEASEQEVEAFVPELPLEGGN